MLVIAKTGPENTKADQDCKAYIIEVVSNLEHTFY